MTRRQRGFTLIEIMIVVVIIGVLAAIAIPLFMGQMKRAKTTEANLQLNVISKGAKTYYQTNAKFPQGTAGVLPAADGAACGGGQTGRIAVTDAWSADPVWSALDFHVDDPALFSYHYESASNTSAVALAVGDLDCDGTHATYTMTFSAVDGLPVTTIVEPPPAAD